MTHNALFLILTQNRGHQFPETTKVLDSLSLDFEVMEDNWQHGSNPRWDGITATVPPGAWAHAMQYLLNSKDSLPDHVWFIEDDVQLHPHEFGQLIDWTHRNVPDCYCTPKRFDRTTEPEWHWFQDNDLPHGAYNQLACVPADIIRVALTRPTRFHELWFAEIAHDLGIPILDWRQNPQTSHLFGPWEWRPIQEPGTGLRHPVK